MVSSVYILALSIITYKFHFGIVQVRNMIFINAVLNTRNAIHDHHKRKRRRERVVASKLENQHYHYMIQSYLPLVI